MLHALNALAPVFFLIGLGALIRSRRWLSDDFWESAEKITYYVFFPALLFSNTASADFSEIEVLPVMLVSVLAAMGSATACLCLRPVLGVGGPAFSSVFQGAIRPNTYVGLGAAAALYGDVGLSIVAVCVAAVVPLVNLLSVGAMVRYASTGGGGFFKGLREIAKNPLILACLTGWGFNAVNVGSPPVVGDVLALLGRAALPIGLLAVGAGLDLKSAAGAGKAVGASTFLKLLALPGLTALLCTPLGVEGTERAICLIYSAVPCSASAYVLARQMGGDAKLMAAIITLSTIASVAVMPALILTL